MSIHLRKGAKRISEIPLEVLVALNKGQTSTVNLMEGLAIDNKLLISNVLTEIEKKQYISSVSNAIDLLSLKTITKVNLAIGITLLNEAKKLNDLDLFSYLSNHTSDVVRGWASYMIGFDSDLNIEDKLLAIRTFATDSHFGVREFAWMVVRDSVARDLAISLKILSKWVLEDDANIRRFASEVTRPRGVWCSHIQALKTNPNLAIAILEPLHTDSSKYVQNSVANWLNDASKSDADWVRQTCAHWQSISNTKETAYIVKRGLRTLEKNSITD